jgi:hypothetical protein
MTQEDFLAQIAEHLDELVQDAEEAQRPPAP